MNNLTTPWGKAHYVQLHGGDGQVLGVGTASHGGIGVHPAISLPQPFEALALVDEEGWRWFEEDEAWAAAVLALPQRFPGELQQKAQETLRHCLPDVYSAHFKVTLTSKDSYVLGQREREAATAGNFIPTCALDSSYYDVPEGHVWVSGWRRRDEATEGFLLPEEAYASGDPYLVLDSFRRWMPNTAMPRRKALAAA